MSLNYYFEEVDEFPLAQNIDQWIDQTAQSEGKKAGEISFIFCSNNYLLNINREYLNHDYFTDVITFDYVEGDLISGDIFISLEMIAENAKEYNVSFLDELNRIMIHGVLHLLGYKDKTDEEKQMMTAKENEYLSKR